MYKLIRFILLKSYPNIPSYYSRLQLTCLRLFWKVVLYSRTFSGTSIQSIVHWRTYLWTIQARSSHATNEASWISCKQLCKLSAYLQHQYGISVSLSQNSWIHNRVLEFQRISDCVSTSPSNWNWSALHPEWHLWQDRSRAMYVVSRLDLSAAFDTVNHSVV